MTAEFKKIIIREGLIFSGFIALFLIGFALVRTAFNSLAAQTLILIGLYGYPVFVIIRYAVTTVKIFKNLAAAGQRKRITIILLSIVGLYLAILMQNYTMNRFSGKDAPKTSEASSDFFTNPAGLSENSECTVTAKILSVEEKRYDDVTIMRQKHSWQGVTKIFMQLQILRVEGLFRKKPANEAESRMCKVGQIVDVYAYKDTDIVGTQPLIKFDNIKCDIMALPVSSEGFYYKVSRIRRR